MKSIYTKINTEWAYREKSSIGELEFFLSEFEFKGTEARITIFGCEDAFYI